MYSKMSNENIAQLLKEMNEIRILLAAISIHQNNRLEMLEQWAERKNNGFFGKWINGEPTIRINAFFRTPFAPIRHKLERIRKVFATKLSKWQGYEKLAEEYSKDGKLIIGLILINYFQNWSKLRLWLDFKFHLTKKRRNE